MRALLVVVAGVLVGLTVGAAAESASTSMSVSLTVVRSCTVGAGDATTVTLQCSRGVNSVSVNHSSSPATPDVRPLVSGANTLSVSDAKGAVREPQPVVTLNF